MKYKKIGEGWQYSVYDLGNGRVLKKYHSWLGSFWVMFKDCYPFTNHWPTEFPSFIRAGRQIAIESFKILEEHQVSPEWIGNPKFLGALDFEQDKVTPLHEVFETARTEEIKKYVDLFIELNSRFLKLGFIDKSFNITKNYGIAKNGNLVLTDIGELFDNPEKIKRQLNDKVWYKSYVGGCIKDLEARKYFLDQMDKFAKIYR